MIKFPALVERLTNTIHSSPGAVTPEIRRTIEAWATKLDQMPSASTELPEVIKNYVKKVALHAYRVTNDDIEALKQAGYSEDAIFEITLSAALGAGLKRLNCGLAALKG